MKTGALFEKAPTPDPGIIDIGDRKQHFLDDLLVDEASRISRYMSRPTKCADNPIMTADFPLSRAHGTYHILKRPSSWS